MCELEFDWNAVGYTVVPLYFFIILYYLTTLDLNISCNLQCKEGTTAAYCTLFSLARVASVDESLHYSCQYLRTALADISER